MGTGKEPVTGSVLQWAIEESGYALTDVAARLQVEETVLRAWMAEADQPSTGQLTRLARYLKRPRLLFYRPHPPPASTPLPLRQAATGSGTVRLAPAERLTLRLARRMQAAVSPLVQGVEGPSVDIPQFSKTDPPAAVGAALRQWIAPRHEGRHRDFGAWRQAVPQRRILVFAQSVSFPSQTVRGRRPILRGFALPDPYAPVMGLITADNPAARAFTLFHALAHLAPSHPAQACGAMEPAADPCAAAPAGDEMAAHERWCDAVARHALIPASELRAMVAGHHPDLALVRKVARRFRVSHRAAAVALIQEAQAPRTLYAAVRKRWPLLDRTRQGGGQGRGRSRAGRRVNEWGDRTMGLILHAYGQGAVDELRIRRWLDLSGPQIDEAQALIEVHDFPRHKAVIP